MIIRIEFLWLSLTVFPVFKRIIFVTVLLETCKHTVFWNWEAPDCGVIIVKTHMIVIHSHHLFTVLQYCTLWLKFWNMWQNYILPNGCCCSSWSNSELLFLKPQIWEHKSPSLNHCQNVVITFSSHIWDIVNQSNRCSCCNCNLHVTN